MSQPAPHPPWLIVGLGNPGPRYENTRHNVGFMAIHHLAALAGISARQEGKFNAMAGKGELNGTPVFLVQPLTFMNLSGDAVSKMAHYYKIPPENTLVIFDDTALPFGKIRVRPGGSDGGHNGIKSLIRGFGGVSTFPRIRIGIGPPEGVASMEQYVLARFDDAEMALMPELMALMTQALLCLLQEGISEARNRFNGMNLLAEEPPADPTTAPTERP